MACGSSEETLTGGGGEPSLLVTFSATGAALLVPAAMSKRG